MLSGSFGVKEDARMAWPSRDTSCYDDSCTRHVHAPVETVDGQRQRRAAASAELAASGGDGRQRCGQRFVVYVFLNTTEACAVHAPRSL